MDAVGRITRNRALRGAALMPAAALGVHQLRYELAFGARAPRALSAQGHAYLATLAPWVVLLAALALGAALGALARRWGTGAAASTPRAGLRVWLLAALALLAVYSGQELLEGLLAAGHPGGLLGVYGSGGWWAVPAALAIAGLLALALRVAAVVEDVVAAAALRVPRVLRGAADMRAVATPLPFALDPLAHAVGGRGPPLARSS